MSVLEDIRGAIVTKLAAQLVFNHENGYLMTPPVPPCFEVDMQDTAITYGPSFQRGDDEYFLVVRGIVQIGDSREAQRQMDAWLEPAGNTSVKTLLEADKTLGLAKVDGVFVRSVNAHKRLATPDKPNATLLCSEWLVELTVSP